MSDQDIPPGFFRCLHGKEAHEICLYMGACIRQVTQFWKKSQLMLHPWHKYVYRLHSVIFHVNKIFQLEKNYFPIYWIQFEHQCNSKHTSFSLPNMLDIEMSVNSLRGTSFTKYNIFLFQVHKTKYQEWVIYYIDALGKPAHSPWYMKEEKHKSHCWLSR